MGILGSECDGVWGRTGVTARFAGLFAVLPRYNISKRFTRVYDATTELSVFLGLEYRFGKVGISFSSKCRHGKV